jgi:hypothetical protein
MPTTQERGNAISTARPLWQNCGRIGHRAERLRFDQRFSERLAKTAG